MLSIDRIKDCEKMLDRISTCQIYDLSKKRRYESLLDRVRKLDEVMNIARSIECRNERQRAELNKLKQRIGRTKGKACRKIHIYKRKRSKRRFNMAICAVVLCGITAIGSYMLEPRVITEYGFDEVSNVNIDMYADIGDKLSGDQVLEIIKLVDGRIEKLNDCHGECQYKDWDISVFNNNIDDNYYTVYAKFDHKCEGFLHDRWNWHCVDVKIKK